jgi:peptidoglycan/xylan/chitin deacetylase (PgdA/CDA1 family)
MFHHFHNSKHPKGQGSLSSDDFEQMIDWLSAKYQLLNADEYLSKLESQRLKDNEICLSFDDALLCQFEIAGPILDRRGIRAFFFVYSSPFCGVPDPMEIYRYFRTTEFSNIDEFYARFFLQTQANFPESYTDALKTYGGNEYLSAFPFYTDNDRWFRYLRDLILGKSKYDEIMNQLMIDRHFNQESASKNLWMSDKDIQELHTNGHIVGLHSYSHSTMLHLLTMDQQEAEYQKNFDHLSSVLSIGPVAMSHPCGNYNDDTLRILKRFGIRIGFRSNNSVTQINTCLEVPRNDHANIYKEMKR